MVPGFGLPRLECVDRPGRGQDAKSDSAPAAASATADDDSKADDAKTDEKQSADKKEGKLTSGPQPGDELGPFQVEKLAGASADNVDIGGKLCYRCMLGDRPVIMVFTSDLTPPLGDLMTALDKKVKEKAQKKLASFIVLLNDSDDILNLAATAAVDQLKVQNVAIVKSLDDKAKGPASYKLNPEAATTVLVYREGKVEANYALKPGEINRKSISAIMSSTDRMLKKKPGEAKPADTKASPRPTAKTPRPPANSIRLMRSHANAPANLAAGVCFWHGRGLFQLGVTQLDRVAGRIGRDLDRDGPSDGSRLAQSFGPLLAIVETARDFERRFAGCGGQRQIDGELGRVLLGLLQLTERLGFHQAGIGFRFDQIAQGAKSLILCPGGS